MGQAEQDPDLPRSASNVLGKVQSRLCFNRVAGQVEVLAGQVNFRGSLPRLGNNLLKAMLHPVMIIRNSLINNRMLRKCVYYRSKH